MSSLIDLSFDKALAYPVIDPSRNVLFSSLLIWNQIELIWGEQDSDMRSFRENAWYSPIFHDKGLVRLKEPRPKEIGKASKQFKKLRPFYEREIADGGNFFVSPSKIDYDYWPNARKKKNGFIDVPGHVGRLYLGLLASEMAKRPDDIVPTLTTRIEEPVFLEGGLTQPAEGLTREECIAKAGFRCLLPNSDLDGLSIDQVKSLCHDILKLRKLDSWYKWREQLYDYKARLKPLSSMEEVRAIANDLNEKVVKFQKDANKRKLLLLGKGAITAVGAVAGFFVGSIGGAILGASAGAATLGVEFYQAGEQRRRGKQTVEQFVIDGKKILATYGVSNQ